MKVEKLNLDVTHLDDVVVLKENATFDYFRQLEERAKKKGILARSGMDKLGRCFFTTNNGVNKYRYTLVR